MLVGKFTQVHQKIDILPPNPIMPLLLSEADHVILTRLEEDMWREDTDCAFAKTVRYG
jgi:hypothetical protein